MSLDFKLPKSFNGITLADAIQNSFSKIGDYEIGRTQEERTISIRAHSSNNLKPSITITLNSNASYSHLTLHGELSQNGFYDSFLNSVLEELS